MSESMTPTMDDFASMFEASIEASPMQEGKVVSGLVTGIEKDIVIVDVGLKTEGRIDAREFFTPGEDTMPKVGDTVDIYLERIENALGQAVLSRDKARREEAWVKMHKFFEKEEPVNGEIVGRVKGGFTVDLGGINAFLPGSQVDIRPVRDIGPLMGQTQPFMILKMDRSRGNIVVSRRAILEESRAEQRAELVSELQEGETRDGVVKNITDYGAFVDLGGIDGLLHVTDMSWRRVSHPSQVLNVGDTVQVKIIRINPETQRISLGMKQLQEDPKSKSKFSTSIKRSAASHSVSSRFKATLGTISPTVSRASRSVSSNLQKTRRQPERPVQTAAQLSHVQSSTCSLQVWMLPSAKKAMLKPSSARVICPVSALNSVRNVSLSEIRLTP